MENRTNGRPPVEVGISDGSTADRLRQLPTPIAPSHMSDAEMIEALADRPPESFGLYRDRPMPAPGKVDHLALMRISRDLLIAIGEDPDRPGLADTPRRWADWWREFIEYDPGKTGTTFEQVEADQMVVVSGMRVWSLCEHHLLPFWCDVAIAYVAHDRVLGLSKFGRIAHQFGHRLQLQEQLGKQIADEVQRLTRTRDVAVVVSGEHLCMSMRGIRTPARMTSSVMRGMFRENQAARAELLSLIKLADR